MLALALTVLFPLAAVAALLAASLAESSRMATLEVARPARHLHAFDRAQQTHPSMTVGRGHLS